MTNEPNIRTFSAADIEKYHRGQLSAVEMHALEKAALDDPFLADALEGFATPGVAVAADLAALSNRLADRIQATNKVIELPKARLSVRWLRAAAMIVLVAGAGFLVYRLASGEKQHEIAQEQSMVPGKAATNQPIASPKTDSLAVAGQNRLQSPGNTADTSVLVSTGNSFSITVPRDSLITNDFYYNNTATAATPPPVARYETSNLNGIVGSDRNKRLDYTISDKSFDSSRAGNLSGFYKDEELKKQKAMAFSEDARADRNTQNAMAYRVTPKHTNIFRGRVTDANYNALPFANITNTADSIGTYADAKGNFVLISPDSVLNVQVRSIGFENRVAKLNNFAASNQVTMDEDKSLGEVVISNRQFNSASRSRNNTMVLEEPEPVDGWVNYDTYLANNLVVPETFRSRQTSINGAVELSFEVNQNGDPVNITVEKSLCESCDKEAIRLVKEGPKWKRKARKGRTTVTITF